MKKITIFVILILCVQFLQADSLEDRRAKLLTDKHISQLTIDFGVISCWKRGPIKYVVIDYVGTIYAVNGKARGHSRKAGWKDAESILKKNGDHMVFSDIIQVAFNNGCTQYYGK